MVDGTYLSIYTIYYERTIKYGACSNLIYLLFKSISPRV